MYCPIKKQAFSAPRGIQYCPYCGQKIGPEGKHHINTAVHPELMRGDITELYLKDGNIYTRYIVDNMLGVNSICCIYFYDAKQNPIVTKHPGTKSYHGKLFGKLYLDEPFIPNRNHALIEKNIGIPRCVLDELKQGLQGVKFFRMKCILYAFPDGENGKAIEIAQFMSHPQGLGDMKINGRDF